MNEAEFCTVLGNLLENALDAAGNIPAATPFIRLRAKEENSHLALTVDNSCSSAPVEENGRFLSTKHDGFGTGTASGPLDRGTLSRGRHVPVCGPMFFRLRVPLICDL